MLTELFIFLAEPWRKSGDRMPHHLGTSIRPSFFQVDRYGEDEFPVPGVLPWEKIPPMASQEMISWLVIQVDRSDEALIALARRIVQETRVYAGGRQASWEEIAASPNVELRKRFPHDRTGRRVCEATVVFVMPEYVWRETPAQIRQGNEEAAEERAYGTLGSRYRAGTLF